MEKLSPKETVKGTHTVLRGSVRPPEGFSRASLRLQNRGSPAPKILQPRNSPEWTVFPHCPGIFNSCPDYQNKRSCIPFTSRLASSASSCRQCSVNLTLLPNDGNYLKATVENTRGSVEKLYPKAKPRLQNLSCFLGRFPNPMKDWQILSAISSMVFLHSALYLVAVCEVVFALSQ